MSMRSSLLAAGAVVGYIVAASVGSGQPTPTQVATVAGNLTALLLDLIKAKPATSKGTYLQKVSVSSTMGPGVTVDQSSLTLK